MKFSSESELPIDSPASLETTHKDVTPTVLETPRISPRPIHKSHAEPLAIGEYQGIDARNAQRFRKGKSKIDGTLDLHGLSRESAYVRVMTYIQQSYDLGRRVVLIITGRGNFQTEKPASERGILRQSLPQWLNDPAVRSLVLAFDQAQIKDGGQGAFYVFIRRKRQ
jgi:DNA-nicking Smr family endonuclease